MRVASLVLFLSACGASTGSSTGEVRETETSGSERAPLDVANATLPNVCGDGTPITVTGGAASYESGLGEGLEGELEISAIATRDLDGDGTLEHLAMVRCMPGGSGTFDGVWAFHDEANGPTVVAHIEGGDRADGGLEGARLEGTAVIVGRQSGSDEGVCCPTHVTDETWQLTDGTFVRTSVGEPRPIPN